MEGSSFSEMKIDSKKIKVVDNENLVSIHCFNIKIFYIKFKSA